MRKILNPWIGMDGYNCFGCCPDNQQGMRMQFFEDGDDIVSMWKPSQYHISWKNTLHGGVQAALLDEICGWVIFRKCKSAGVTGKLELKYHRAISLEPIMLKAHITLNRGRVVVVEGTIYDSKGNICTVATATYFVADKQKAQEMGFIDCEVEE